MIKTHGSTMRSVCTLLGTLALSWLLGLPTPGVLAAQAVCDPGLETGSEDPRAYKQREDRCEGIYRLKVNSDKLRLRSWTASFEDYDPRSGRPLQIAWNGPSGATGVHLRATALKPQTYYRMDTDLSGRNGSWSWPTGFLEQLDLGRADIGLVGWTTVATELAGEQQVYLPLAVHQGRPTEAAGYRVVLVPGERLVEVEWSMAPVANDGNIGAPIAEPRALGYGYYPARQPTEFEVPVPPRPGIWVLHLRASLRTEPVPVSRQIWFYHGDDAAMAAMTMERGTEPAQREEGMR